MNPDYRLPSSQDSYGFGFLDEFTKREIRRVILKAISIPAIRRLCLTGNAHGPGLWHRRLQLTLSMIGPDDTLKVIDQARTIPSTP